MLPLDIFHQDSATAWVIGKCWAFPCQHKQHDWISSWKQISHARSEFFLEPDVTHDKNSISSHLILSTNMTHFKSIPHVWLCCKIGPFISRNVFYFRTRQIVARIQQWCKNHCDYCIKSCWKHKKQLVFHSLNSILH